VTSTGSIITTGSTPPDGFVADKEYWDIDSTFANAATSPTAGTTIALAVATRGTNPSISAPVINTRPQPWTSLAAAPGGSNFWNTTGANAALGLSFSLTTTGNPWSGTITWYVARTDTNYPGAVVGTSTPASGQTFTYGATPPSSPNKWNWYTMTLPVVANTYRLKNVGTGTFLNLNSGSNSGSGTNANAVVAVSDDVPDTQRWYLVPAGTAYKILNLAPATAGDQPGAYLDIDPSVSTGNIRGKSNMTNANQTWTLALTGDSDGSYFITSTIGSNKYYLYLSSTTTGAQAGGTTSTATPTDSKYKWKLVGALPSS
jgi:hypothetical protein